MGRGGEACLNDHVVDHFITAKAWPNDDGVKALQPVLDGSQRLVKNLLLLVFWQLYAREEGYVGKQVCHIPSVPVAAPRTTALSRTEHDVTL